MDKIRYHLYPALAVAGIVVALVLAVAGVAAVSPSLCDGTSPTHEWCD